MPFVLTGALLAAVIAGVALRVRALEASGAIAAFIVGTATFGAGGLGGAAVLLAFFISSILLTRVGRAKKRELRDIAKGGPRDALQVLANGGVATACIIALAAHAGHAWGFAFAGAYAAATADTWGTEIGTLVRALPRELFTRSTLATGLSGGVTLAGTVAECAGAAFIAAVAWSTAIVPDARAAAVVLLAGIAGAFADSALGATLQEQRWCPQCQRACENDPHACGTATVFRRGLSWMTNDVVNSLATVVGAAFAFAFAG
jgi:uncharacterized protein (TIGR00297 family)